MLTQLTTVKSRLGIAPTDVTHDDLLNRAITALSQRFDRECNRKLGRTVGAVQEFAAAETEIVAEAYPIESVTRWEIKSSEATGWVEQTGAQWLVRGGCVISLSQPLALSAQAMFQAPVVGRVTYTGGYVMPGGALGAGQTSLPGDIEFAAVEQVAVWFQQRDKLGLVRHWPSGGTYLVFSQLPLLPQVTATLRAYRRVAL